MTKKLLITLSIFALFASCGTRSGNATISDCLDGVVINGVRWATRNVATPGTFATTPEDVGMLFQWNRKRAWSATDEEVEGWDNTDEEGTKWYPENDPCPEGWRIPTRAELESLYHTDSRWTRQNRVYGRLFGTAPYQIFLPITGWRHYQYGSLVYQDEAGAYWSSTRSWMNALAMEFDDNYVDVHIFGRSAGIAIRCVSVDSEILIEDTGNDLDALIEAKLEALGYSEEMLAEMDEEQLTALLESVLETVLESFADTLSDIFPGMTFETHLFTSTVTVPNNPEGVMIYDVRWATTNVDAPGTFAANPEDFGMFFQWNRRKGWNAVDESVEGWDNSIPAGMEWYAANDPCPPGWRVPTEEDLRSLYSADSERVTLNGVVGHLFGTAPYQIFLPAAGWRSYYCGTLGGVEFNGFYRSSSPRWTSVFDLRFGGTATNIGGGRGRALGLSVRCVAIE